MEKFSQFTEGLIFLCLFAVMVIVPCYLIFLIGRGMMDEMGRYPTQAPKIQFSALLRLSLVMMGAYVYLVLFFRFFAN